MWVLLLVLQHAVQLNSVMLDYSDFVHNDCSKAECAYLNVC